MVGVPHEACDQSSSTANSEVGMVGILQLRKVGCLGPYITGRREVDESFIASYWVTRLVLGSALTH